MHGNKIGTSFRKQSSVYLFIIFQIAIFQKHDDKVRKLLKAGKLSSKWGKSA